MNSIRPGSHRAMMDELARMTKELEDSYVAKGRPVTSGLAPYRDIGPRYDSKPTQPKE